MNNIDFAISELCELRREYTQEKDKVDNLIIRNCERVEEIRKYIEILKENDEINFFSPRKSNSLFVERLNRELDSIRNIEEEMEKLVIKSDYYSKKISKINKIYNSLS